MQQDDRLLDRLEEERIRAARLERVPVLGRMAVDALDAWLGLLDAMNLGGLHTVLRTTPDRLSPDRRPHGDHRAPPLRDGRTGGARPAARSSLPLPGRAA
jgi:hypothetical protein